MKKIFDFLEEKKITYSIVKYLSKLKAEGTESRSRYMIIISTNQSKEIRKVFRLNKDFNILEYDLSFKETIEFKSMFDEKYELVMKKSYGKVYEPINQGHSVAKIVKRQREQDRLTEERESRRISRIIDNQFK